MIYVTTDFSEVWAFDARTGQKLWSFDPETRAWQINTCCSPANRGVAIWGDKVFVGALDGRLIALEAKTGKLVWSTQTFPKSTRLSITGAPRVIKGVVIIGNGGAELGARGFVAGFDAETGKQKWKFWMVPGKEDHDGEVSDKAMKIAYPTWHGHWWDYGGGGTPWDGMAYDPDLDLLYVGGGNGSPWNSQLRSPGGGDNLFLGSIVALKPETGEYAWHFQETPGDSWDYTSTQPLILADIKIDGQVRKTLLHAPKNGFFYVLDRATGKFIHGTNYSVVNLGHGPGRQRPADREPRRPLRRHRQALCVDPRPGRRARLAADVVQPQERAGLHPDLGRLLPLPRRSHRRRHRPQQARLQHRRRRLLRHRGQPRGGRRQARRLRHRRRSPRLLPPGLGPRRPEAVWKAPQVKNFNGGVLSTAGGLVFEGNQVNEINAYKDDTGQKLWTFDARPA
ncbi:MAG: PQQ-binding-like beta-propeller repeat protein [Caulobacteraceae bacterium]